MSDHARSEPRRDSTSGPPFWKRVLIIGAVIFALVLLSVFVWYALYVLLLVFAGILLAILIRAPADALQKYAKVSENWSVALVLGAALVLLLGAGWMIAPPLATQIEALATAIPEAVEALRDRLRQYGWGTWLVRQVETMGRLPEETPQIVTRATTVVMTVGGAVVSIIVVLFVGLYLSVNPAMYVRGVLRLLPMQHRERGAEIMAGLRYTLQWWLLGQMVAMVSVGVMTGVGLWLLGVPLPFALGLLAFLLDFVPNFGPIIAAVPAVLLALVDSPQQALYVIILYTVVQQIESFLITPLIHQKTVLLPPALTIVAQVLLGILAGPLGLLLATPLTAAAMVLAKMLYVEDALGDEVDTPDDHMDPADKPEVPLPDRVGKSQSAEPQRRRHGDQSPRAPAHERGAPPRRPAPKSRD